MERSDPSLKFYNTDTIINNLQLSDETQRQASQLRKIRNQIVHGIETPDSSSLEKLSKSIKELENRLKKTKKGVNYNPLP